MRTSCLTGPLGLSAKFCSTGRIRAVQLNYTEAHDQLQQAIRRAPPPITAPGFYQTVHKFFVVVELLMGEIPDRQTFRHPVLERALQPYSEIVQGTLLSSVFVPASMILTDPITRSSRARRLPLPIPNNTRPAFRAIFLRGDSDAYIASPTKCHQNWYPEALPGLLTYLAARHLPKTQSRLGRGRRVHRRQGD